MKKLGFILVGLFSIWLILDSFGKPILMSFGVMASENYLSTYQLYINKINAGKGDISAIKKLQGYYGVWKNDPEKMYFWIKKGAVLGNPIDQYHLGVWLYNEKNNKEEGLRWIEKSAKSKYERAIVFLKKHQKPAHISK